MHKETLILLGKQVQHWIAGADGLYKVLAYLRRLRLWWMLAEFGCGPVYGAYREWHRSPEGRKMAGGSIVVISPERRSLFLKMGVSLMGLCYKGQEAIRTFESLTISVKSKKPAIVDYDYKAKSNGSSFINSGHLNFGEMEAGKYMRADGYFDLPYTARKSKQARNVRIHVEWERISEAEIRASIGKTTLDSIGDIRQFLRNEGQL